MPDTQVCRGSPDCWLYDDAHGRVPPSDCGGWADPSGCAACAEFAPFCGEIRCQNICSWELLCFFPAEACVRRIGRSFSDQLATACPRKLAWTLLGPKRDRALSGSAKSEQAGAVLSW